MASDLRKLATDGMSLCDAEPTPVGRYSYDSDGESELSRTSSNSSNQWQQPGESRHLCFGPLLQPSPFFKQQETSEAFRNWIVAHAGPSHLTEDVITRIMWHRLDVELDGPDLNHFRYTAFCLAEAGPAFHRATFAATRDIAEPAAWNERALVDVCKSSERDLVLMSEHSGVFTPSEMSALVERHKDNLNRLDQQQQELLMITKVLTVMFEVQTERERKIARLAAM